MKQFSRLLIALTFLLVGGVGTARAQTPSGPLLLPPITQALDRQLVEIRNETANDPDQAVARLTAPLLQAERGNRAGERIVILTARAQQEARAKRVDRAVADLSSAIAISAAYPLPFFLRSIHEAQRGDRAKAIEDLGKAIAAESRYLPALRARAKLLFEERRWTEVLRDYTQVLTHRPDDVETRFDRAIAYSLSGNKVAALADLDMVLARNPHEPGVLLEKAIMLRGHGDHDAALAILDRLIATGDERGTALKERGILNFARGDFAAAERDLKRAFDLGLGTGLPAPYAAVYLELARIRLGRSDLADLARRQELSFTKAWSNDLAEFLGGKISVDTLIARTRDGTSGAREPDERLCEAQFFIAQRYLAKGATEAAARAFKASMATEVTWFNEHEFSRRELARLGRL